jgi:hypothetical protein
VLAMNRVIQVAIINLKMLIQSQTHMNRTRSLASQMQNNLKVIKLKVNPSMTTIWMTTQ